MKKAIEFNFKRLLRWFYAKIRLEKNSGTKFNISKMDQFFLTKFISGCGKNSENESKRESNVLQTNR